MSVNVVPVRQGRKIVQCVRETRKPTIARLDLDKMILRLTEIRDESADAIVGPSLDLETEETYYGEYGVKLEIWWYRLATAEEIKQDKADKREQRQAAKDAEKKRLYEAVAGNPDLARQLLAEVDTAQANNKGGRA